MLINKSPQLRRQGNTRDCPNRKVACTELERIHRWTSLFYREPHRAASRTIDQATNINGPRTIFSPSACFTTQLIASIESHQHKHHAYAGSLKALGRPSQSPINFQSSKPAPSSFLSSAYFPPNRNRIIQPRSRTTSTKPNSKAEGFPK